MHRAYLAKRVYIKFLLFCGWAFYSLRRKGLFFAFFFITWYLNLFNQNECIKKKISRTISPWFDRL